MRQHTYLPAMVCFVRHHIAEHFRASRPGLSPAISVKRLHPAITAKRFSQHRGTAGGALGQPRTGLLRRAMRAIELPRDLQVRGRKPDPLGADVVHVRKDRRNRADLPRRLGPPRSRVKMFDQDLVHPIIHGKHLDRSSPQLSVNLIFTSGLLTLAHGFLFLGPIILPGRRSYAMRS